MQPTSAAAVLIPGSEGDKYDVACKTGIQVRDSTAIIPIPPPGLLALNAQTCKKSSWAQVGLEKDEVSVQLRGYTR